MITYRRACLSLLVQTPDPLGNQHLDQSVKQYQTPPLRRAPDTVPHSRGYPLSRFLSPKPPVADSLKFLEIEPKSGTVAQRRVSDARRVPCAAAGLSTQSAVPWCGSLSFCPSCPGGAFLGSFQHSPCDQPLPSPNSDAVVLRTPGLEYGFQIRTSVFKIFFR